jgi:hypothetical protein
VQPAALRSLKETSRWIPLPYEFGSEHKGLKNKQNIDANFLDAIVHNCLQIIKGPDVTAWADFHGAHWKSGSDGSAAHSIF